MKLIVAVDENWAIGHKGDQLVYLKEDLKRFRGLTLGHPVILGRRTLATFPGGRPLKGRPNLILSADPSFSAEGAQVFRDLDALLAAAPEDSFVIGGAMVYEALVAAQALAAQGISLTVVDLHTIKPLDEAAIQEAARSCGALVTAEEHQLAGGLFGAVSEVVVRTCPVPMEAVAVQDTFGESGPPEALLVRYGLNADAIAQAVRRCLARKG